MLSQKYKIKTATVRFSPKSFYLCKSHPLLNNDRTMTKEELMRRAIALSEQSVRSGGGPFGAVIARGGVIVAEASNSVTLDNDPTAHAEVNAIRQACSRLATFNLKGCDIYCSCEPCPMCFGAIYWARIDNIYYSNNRKDAARIGFSDDFIYQEISDRKARKPSRCGRTAKIKRSTKSPSPTLPEGEGEGPIEGCVILYPLFSPSPLGRVGEGLLLILEQLLYFI